MKDRRLLPIFLIFTAVSLTGSAYVVLRLTGPFELEAQEGPVVVGLSLLLGLTPPATFALLPLSGGRCVDVVQRIGYSLIGYLSLLLVFVALWDLLRVGSAALRAAGVDGAFLLPWAATGSDAHRGFALVILGGTLLVGTAALISAQRSARVHRTRVTIPNLPAELEGFCIVQISDIHIGPGIGRKRVAAVVEACTALEADLIAVTGDLADGDATRLRVHAEPLAQLSAGHGVWFVTGNHDYYSGVDPWCALASELGMEVLINESRELIHQGVRVQIAGVTDPSGGFFRTDHHPQLEKARGDSEADLRVLLAHQPRCAPAAARLGFHLQLSGHTHGGQFFPHTLLIHAVQRYVAGLYDVAGMKLYVHRGTTWWGPPMRLGSRHEIVALDLTAG